MTEQTLLNPADSAELRTALAMGADAALHVVCEERLDASATVATLRTALEGVRTVDVDPRLLPRRVFVKPGLGRAAA